MFYLSFCLTKKKHHIDNFKLGSSYNFHQLQKRNNFHFNWVCKMLRIITLQLIIIRNIKMFGLWCFNATSNNILPISWWSVFLVEETGVPWENHRPATSHWQTLSHIVVLSTPHLSGVWIHNVSGDRHWLHR